MVPAMMFLQCDDDKKRRRFKVNSAKKIFIRSERHIMTKEILENWNTVHKETFYWLNCFVVAGLNIMNTKNVI